MFINELTQKYFFETVVWNAQSSNFATNYSESYQYARDFLLTQGKNKLVWKKLLGDKNTF